MTAPQEQEVLRPVPLVNLVLVGEVVADRRDVEVSRLDQHFDRLHDRRLERLPFVGRRPWRRVFEVRRVLRELDHGLGDGFVGDRHEALRAAFRPAWIAIHLDETVREIDRRVVAHPVGAELNPVSALARLIEANQPRNHLGLRRIRHGARLLQVRDRLQQVHGVHTWRDLAVRRAGPIDLLPTHAVRPFGDPGVQRILLVNAGEIRERHALIERVRAGLQDVLARARRLRGDHRLERGVEDRPLQGGQLVLQVRRGRERRKVRVWRLEAAVGVRTARGLLELGGRERRQEFLRGVLVVVAAVRPEHQRVRPDLRERCGRDARRPGHDLLEHALFSETERRQLIVDDGINRDRRAREPVGERLLTIVELTEAVGLQLDESGVRHALHERARRWRLRAAGRHKCEGRERYAKERRFHDRSLVSILVPPSRGARACDVSSRAPGRYAPTAPAWP